MSPRDISRCQYCLLHLNHRDRLLEIALIGRVLIAIALFKIALIGFG
jgi:hypothetical protein